MKKFLELILTVAIISSCATTLPPKEERKLVFVEKTNGSKNQNYIKAITHISKAFNDSSKVIKTQDKESGLIILKGNTDCNIFRQMGDSNDYLLQFTLTFNAKDKAVRMLFEDLYISSTTGKTIGWAYNQISDKTKLEESKKCLSGFKDSILSSITKDSEW